MTDTELAWLVGYLEGEGCFYSTKSKQPVVQVVATDRDVVERAGLLMCAKRLTQEPGAKPHHKTRYVVRVFGSGAIALMERVLPLMGERRHRRIREVLDLAAQRPGQVRGERHPMARRSEAEIRDVKRRLRNGERSRDIGRDLGINEKYVAQIKAGSVWQHVEG